MDEQLRAITTEPTWTALSTVAVSAVGMVLTHRRARGGGGGPLPIEMLPMIKMSQKDYCFFCNSFFQHLRVQQYMHTTVINNIDQGGPGPSI